MPVEDMSPGIMASPVRVQRMQRSVSAGGGDRENESDATLVDDERDDVDDRDEDVEGELPKGIAGRDVCDDMFVMVVSRYAEKMLVAGASKTI
ncbi:hypothetical protein SEPCBS119000_002677 [Sporothrix epigloea]|uniref:Uncharacterized protein n=1 Tax=Sporothrix epigloea TaxID=1892477 RepID=A0ABP0DLM0_9PEZI